MREVGKAPGVIEYMQAAVFFVLFAIYYYSAMILGQAWPYSAIYVLVTFILYIVANIDLFRRPLSLRRKLAMMFLYPVIYVTLLVASGAVYYVESRPKIIWQKLVPDMDYPASARAVEWEYSQMSINGDGTSMLVIEVRPTDYDAFVKLPNRHWNPYPLNGDAALVPLPSVGDVGSDHPDARWQYVPDPGINNYEFYAVNPKNHRVYLLDMDL